MRWMAEYVQTPVGDIYTERHPAPGLPVVVALHGFLRTSKMLLPVLEPLAAEAELVNISLPGHGYSPSIPRADLDKVSAAIVSTVGQLVPRRKVVLLGESLGGLVAAAAAPKVDAAFSLLLDPPLAMGKQWTVQRDIRAVCKQAGVNDVSRITAIAETVFGMEPTGIRDLRYHDLLRPIAGRCAILTGDEPLLPERHNLTNVPCCLDDEDLALIRDRFGDAIQVMRFGGTGHVLVDQQPAGVVHVVRQIIAFVGR